jgi:DMSO/TMAO reductase YedYZ molybdopterin-dependent catalytic subunit
VQHALQPMENVVKPERISAFAMNGRALPEVCGAPLRLRVENQLGYKMVEWIERIEFIESEKPIGLASQRKHGIDSGGTTRRNPRREQGDSEQNG